MFSIFKSFFLFEAPHEEARTDGFFEDPNEGQQRERNFCLMKECRRLADERCE
jgi:hypothetical protein